MFIIFWYFLVIFFFHFLSFSFLFSNISWNSFFDNIIFLVFLYFNLFYFCVVLSNNIFLYLEYKKYLIWIIFIADSFIWHGFRRIAQQYKGEGALCEKEKLYLLKTLSVIWVVILDSFEISFRAGNQLIYFTKCIDSILLQQTLNIRNLEGEWKKSSLYREFAI